VAYELHPHALAVRDEPGEPAVPAASPTLNRRHVPSTAVVVVLGSAMAVVMLQLLVTSLTSFFSLVLAAAGFFLLAEFFLDSVTAVVFLTVGHAGFPTWRSSRTHTACSASRLLPRAS